MWLLMEEGTSSRGVGHDRVIWAGDLGAGVASGAARGFYQRCGPGYGDEERRDF